MSAASSYKPKGFQTVIPQLAVSNALEALKFYTKAFGAEQLDVTMDLKGIKVMHSSIRLGDTVLFVHDPMGPAAVTNSSNFYVYIPDVDAAYKRAIEAGCVSTMEPEDQFWGDRMSMVKDPYGSTWALATLKKELSKDEIRKGQEAWMKKMADKSHQSAA